MKKLLYISIYVLALSNFGCEADFEYDPIIDEEIYFIDGLIANIASRNYVTVNKLSSSGEMVAVSGAEVILSDNYGHRYKFHESIAGRYVLSKFRGFPGYTYFLKVKAGDREFHASTKMHSANRKFRITTKPVSDNRTNIYYDYNNLLEKDEFYRIALIINGERFENREWLHVRHITNGSKIFPVAENVRLDNNDLVQVELQSISFDVYQFYLELLLYYSEQDNESLFAPSPGFPEGNFTNGAEGVFRASHILITDAVIN